MVTVLYSPEELLSDAGSILGGAFNETLYFLIAFLAVLFGASAVSYLLVKIIDKDEDPFVAVKFGNLPALPVLGTAFVIFSGAVQVFNVATQFANAGAEIPLSHIALVNCIASIGMELAFAAVFGSVVVASVMFAGPRYVEAGEARSRSRSSKA